MGARCKPGRGEHRRPPAGPAVAVVIAADHLLRDLLSAYVRGLLGVARVIEADSLEAGQAASALGADLVVWHVGNRAVGRGETEALVSGLGRPHAHIVLISSDPAAAAAARGLPGVAVVSPADGARGLADAIARWRRQAAPGGRGVRRATRLTARQREVVGLLARGLTTRMIAERLGISPRTVAVHRAAAAKRLRARTIAELLAIAVGHGLID